WARGAHSINPDTRMQGQNRSSFSYSHVRFHREQTLVAVRWPSHCACCLAAKHGARPSVEHPKAAVAGPRRRQLACFGGDFWGGVAWGGQNFTSLGPGGGAPGSRPRMTDSPRKPG